MGKTVLRSGWMLLFVFMTTALMTARGETYLEQSRPTPVVKTDTSNKASLKIDIYSDRHIEIHPDHYPYNYYNVSISTDRSRYYIGEDIYLTYRVSHDSYVYIFDTDASGVTYQLFPNYYDRSNFARANVRYRLPRYNYHLEVNGPPGYERLTIIAVRERYPFLSDYSRYGRKEPFARIDKSPDAIVNEFKSSVERKEKSLSPESKRIEVVPKSRIRPRPDRYRRDYYHAVDSTTFHVVGHRDWYHRRYPHDYGTIYIRSTPSGAKIYINGKYQEKTPTSVKLEPGDYHIRLSKHGYENWYDTVFLKERSKRSIRATLDKERRKYKSYKDSVGDLQDKGE